MDQAVTVFVAVNLIGTAKGIQEGGILVQGQSEIEIDCLPMDIPEFLEVDITELGIGDVLRVEDMQLDEKLSIKTSSAQIIASVTHQMKEEETVTVEGDETDEAFMEETEEQDKAEGSSDDNDSDE